jgi:hypothetical protein
VSRSEPKIEVPSEWQVQSGRAAFIARAEHLEEQFRTTAVNGT